MNKEIDQYSMVKAANLVFIIYNVAMTRSSNAHFSFFPFFMRNLPQSSGFCLAKQTLILNFYALTVANISVYPGGLRGVRWPGLMLLGLF